MHLNWIGDRSEWTCVTKATHLRTNTSYSSIRESKTSTTLKTESRKTTACKSMGPTFSTVKIALLRLIRSNVLNWKIDVELKNKSNQDNASRTFQHQFNINYTRNIITIGSECRAIRLCFILMFYALFWLRFSCVLNEVTAYIENVKHHDGKPYGCLFFSCSHACIVFISQQQLTQWCQHIEHFIWQTIWKLKGEWKKLFLFSKLFILMDSITWVAKNKAIFFRTASIWFKIESLSNFHR